MRYILPLVPAYPELFLLVMVCVILIADLFVKDDNRIVTYGLAQLALVTRQVEPPLLGTAGAGVALDFEESQATIHVLSDPHLVARPDAAPVRVKQPAIRRVVPQWDSLHAGDCCRSAQSCHRGPGKPRSVSVAQRYR